MSRRCVLMVAMRMVRRHSGRLPALRGGGIVTGAAVTLTLTAEEWQTLAAAAQLGAERQSEQAREIARLYGLSPEVARRAFTAGKSWTVVAAVRLALAGVID